MAIPQMPSYAPVLLLLAAGCASSTPDPQVPQTQVPQPQAAVPQPETPPPDPTPAAPATRKSGAAAPEPPASRKTAPPAVRSTPVEPAPKPVAPPGPSAPRPLDLNALKQRLKDTRAIGLFTKIALKNDVDDLLDAFRAFYAGTGTRTLPDLRQSFSLLMMKVLSLLQDDDPALASTIASSREAIWSLLADPAAFATLQDQG